MFCSEEELYILSVVISENSKGPRLISPGSQDFLEVDSYLYSLESPALQELTAGLEQCLMQMFKAELSMMGAKIILKYI